MKRFLSRIEQHLNRRARSVIELRPQLSKEMLLEAESAFHCDQHKRTHAPQESSYLSEFLR